jgi:hypothetical protein
MAVPVIESYTTAKAEDGNSISLTEPTGLTTDDLCIILVGNDDTTGTAQWDDSTLKPTGFTLIQEVGAGGSVDAHAAAFYRVITGAESWPIAVPAQSTQDYVGWAIRVSGVDTSTPLHQTGAGYTGTASPHTITGVTTTIDDCMCFYVCAGDGSDTLSHSVGSPWTQEAEDSAIVSTPSSALGISWGYQALASQGASGSAVVTFNSSDGAAGITFAIAPGSAAAVPQIIQQL